MSFNVHEPPMNVRVYFSIPYKDKEDAKELGCRWDPDRKQWYCIDSDYGKSNISKCLKIWDEPEPYKIINDKKIFISQISNNNRGYTTIN